MPATARASSSCFSSRGPDDDDDDDDEDDNAAAAAGGGKRSGIARDGSLVPLLPSRAAGAGSGGPCSSAARVLFFRPLGLPRGFVPRGVCGLLSHCLVGETVLDFLTIFRKLSIAPMFELPLCRPAILT